MAALLLSVCLPHHVHVQGPPLLLRHHMSAHHVACPCLCLLPHLLLLPLVQAVYSLDDGTVDLFGLHG